MDRSTKGNELPKLLLGLQPDVSYNAASLRLVNTPLAPGRTLSHFRLHREIPEAGILNE